MLHQYAVRAKNGGQSPLVKYLYSVFNNSDSQDCLRRKDEVARQVDGCRDGPLVHRCWLIIAIIVI